MFLCLKFICMNKIIYGDYSKRRKDSIAANISAYYLKTNLLAYLLYVSVASLPSPSSNMEAWPNGTSPRFASLLHLRHQGYVNIADYVIVISSLATVLHLNLILSYFNFQPIRSRAVMLFT